ncbi:hypothetical protein CKJ57_22460 [Mycobacterium intracellulare subsp. chimaera]|nr:hypothetical protein CKJ57_22460 [Mycobacterium intracellulare subsp. chimaera]
MLPVRSPRRSPALRVGIVGWLAAAFLLASWCGGLAAGSPGGTPDRDAAVSRYGGCLASQKAGDLLILVDESGSLKDTDAHAARVDAAKYLVKTLGNYADRTNSKLDVAIAGFSDGYTIRQYWAPLTSATVDSVGSQLQTLAQRNSGADTDYWLALDGARQTLGDHAQGNPNRCQAIAWFSDGKIDFSQRPGGRPYAPGVDLGTQAGVDEMVRRATESICRPGGLADQLRSAHIVMLGVGLGDTGSDFDVMSAIATGVGTNGTACGAIKDPKPGAFFRVSNIDQMLFAFDALNPTPRTEDSKPVCRDKVCQEARHNFVLDRSVKSVNILGSGGMPGIMPYLISPSGQQLQLPKKDGKVDASIDGMPVSYQWQSESAQTISMRGADSPRWAGQWAVVYVDTTGQHPDAVSHVAIHITTDIFPALKNDPGTSWHAGQAVRGVTFGLVDGQGNPVDPNSLAGEATMSAVLEADGTAPIPLIDSTGKAGIGKPVDVDLGKVKPGPATVRMSLVITTAPAPGRNGGPSIPGTTLSPQQVDTPVQILPKVGLPTPGERIDFGTVQGTKGATARLDVVGPGCIWMNKDDRPSVAAEPDSVGAVDVTSTATGPDKCIAVEQGQESSLPVTLRTERDGHGGLAGKMPIHVAAKGNPNDVQVIDVAFSASMVRPLSTTNFALVFIAALLLGPGIPLALLYGAKWHTGKIPGAPMLAQRIPVDVEDGVVLRDGKPFEMADTDLVAPVPGLAGGASALMVEGVRLSTTLGRSPFGSAHVAVDVPGFVSAGSEVPSTDGTGLRAVLPLAVHGKWVVLHDPGAAANHAEVLLMVPGQADVTQRNRIYEDVERRLPEVFTALRQRAAEAQLVPAESGEAEPASPFGPAAVPDAGFDPFAQDTDTQGGQSPFNQGGA